MRLAYFASPYELLDVKRPGQDRHFTREGNNINLHTEINYFLHVVLVLVITRWKLVIITNPKISGKIKGDDVSFKLG